MSYEAYRYAADGSAGMVGDGRVVERGTLAECREAVRGELGLTRLHPSRRWDGLSEDGDVEAYHDYPAHHRLANGCGGYAIRLVTSSTGEKENRDDCYWIR